MSGSVGIGMLGVGNVGAGVTAALAAGAERYAGRAGRPIEVRRALVRDTSRERPGLPPDRLTSDPAEVLDDPTVDIVVELLGHEEPARTYIERALSAGRHVVTANKEVMAKHGAELLRLADERRVRLLYEAAVGGGIPIISPLRRDLLANELVAITAIINGTTNYMLTEMSAGGVAYADVLAEAQRLGYAEPDPAADVEGIDAAYKLAILCGLAFHADVRPEDVVRQGIATLEERDFRYAEALGYTIKLLAHGALEEGELIASVCPTLIASDEPLAKVDGVLNAVQVEGDLVGRVVFEGPGAGAGPTPSAVLADVLSVARDVVTGRPPSPPLRVHPMRVRPPGEHRTRYYLRLRVADQPAVLARLAGALGDRDISIASVMQFETDGDAQTAELVITTHLAPTAAVLEALEEIRGFEIVREVGSVLPMMGTPR